MKVFLIEMHYRASGGSFKKLSKIAFTIFIFTFAIEQIAFANQTICKGNS